MVKSRALVVRAPALNLTAVRGEDCRFFKMDDSPSVELIITHEDSRDEIRMSVCPDNLKFRQKELLKVVKGELVGSIAIMVEVTIKDKQRVIVVDEQVRTEEEKETEEGSLVVELAEVVISINQNS